MILPGVDFVVALVIGKTLGVMVATWLVVRVGWGRLAPGVTWTGICLIGPLSGIGFTLSLFIAKLAFVDEALLAGGKLGVLLGSLVAAVMGLACGLTYSRRMASHGKASAQVEGWPTICRDQRPRRVRDVGDARWQDIAARQTPK